jgi:signal transduction histidine kinase
MGMTSMRERVEKVGGVLEIISAPGKGARVKVSVKRGT